MGAKMGPSFANLVLGYMENAFSTNIMDPNLNFTFLTSVNSFHLALKYTFM